MCHSLHNSTELLVLCHHTLTPRTHLLSQSNASASLNIKAKCTLLLFRWVFWAGKLWLVFLDLSCTCEAPWLPFHSVFPPRGHVSLCLHQQPLALSSPEGLVEDTRDLDPVGLGWALGRGTLNSGRTGALIFILSLAWGKVGLQPQISICPASSTDNGSVSQVLLLPICSWGNWGPRTWSDLWKITGSHLKLLLLIPSPGFCQRLRRKERCGGRTAPSNVPAADGTERTCPLWRKMPPLGYFDVVFREGLVLSRFSVTFPEFWGFFLKLMLP